MSICGRYIGVTSTYNWTDVRTHESGVHTTTVGPSWAGDDDVLDFRWLRLPADAIAIGTCTLAWVSGNYLLLRATRNMCGTHSLMHTRGRARSDNTGIKGNKQLTKFLFYFPFDRRRD